MTLCPCGSNKTYPDCCGKFISGQMLPTTPEELMRSRYTAYTHANIDYIIQTMQGPALKGFDAESAHLWAKQVQWEKLKVIKTRSGKSRGYVEFRAYYFHNNQAHIMHEISEFYFDHKRWYYIGQKKGTL
jgi:SEC-C motif-containing protein